ncbi:MAG: hypothetical protein OXL97_03385 [Chloroflexota bacterium]|nr:hypothetical protein [Chloroflexota bacterium]MDE2885885.1 hypothetical protein [Chloroflexota bacterium]
MSEIERLASLIRQRNAVDNQISAVIGRPVHAGHLAEAITAKIFNIDLHESAAHKGNDGIFTGGSYVGKTVDIKGYSSKDTLGMPDEGKTGFDESLPDFYLVLAGPRKSAISSRGATAPWTIHSVHLFDARALVEKLRKRRPPPKINEATSIALEYWDAAEIYPRNNPVFPLTESQREMLALFSEASVG